MDAGAQYTEGQHQKGHAALLFLLRQVQELHIMVETVEVVRQRIDIGADAVRCEVLPCTVDLILITCEKHLDIMC